MLWLLATLGSAIELAEVPTIIWLLVVVVRQRRRLLALERGWRRELREARWGSGEPGPRALAEDPNDE